MLSVGCESESSLAGWIWFRVSHGVAIRCLLRPKSSDCLTWTGGYPSKEVGLLTGLASWFWLLSKELSSSPHGKLPHEMMAGFPETEFISAQWIDPYMKIELQPICSIQPRKPTTTSVAISLKWFGLD